MTTSKKDLGHQMAEKLVDYKQQVDFLLRVIDASPLPMILTDLDGKLTHGNPAYLRLCGATLPRVLGSGWTRFVVPRLLPEISRRWMESTRNRDEIATGTVVYTKDPNVTCHYRMVLIEGTGYCGFVVPETCICVDWVAHTTPDPT